MRNGLLGSIAVLVASAGIALAQPPAPTPGSSALVSPVPLKTEPLPTLPPPTPVPDPSMAPLLPGMEAPPGDDTIYLERIWFRPELLIWWSRPGPSRWPLIMTGNQLEGPIPGAAGAVLIFGGREFDWHTFVGARATVGSWLPGSTRVGLEASGLVLERRPIVENVSTGPLGIPTIGTPFINDLTGALDFVGASSPGNPGAMSGLAHSQFWGTELNMLFNFYRGPRFRWNQILGFRNFNLAETIAVSAQTLVNTPGPTFLGAAAPVGSTLRWEDRFETNNHYYSGQIGSDFEVHWRYFVFNFTTKTAAGDIRRSVESSSFTQQSGGGAPTQTVPGGVLAALTNFGRRVDNEFSWSQELGVRLAVHLTRGFMFYYGADWIYWDGTVRPGDQIDPFVNPTIVPRRPEHGALLGGNAFPNRIFDGSHYWAGGIKFGFTVQY